MESNVTLYEFRIAVAMFALCVFLAWLYVGFLFDRLANRIDCEQSIIRDLQRQIDCLEANIVFEQGHPLRHDLRHERSRRHGG